MSKKRRRRNFYSVWIKREFVKPNYLIAGANVNANTPQQAHRFFVEHTGYPVTMEQLEIKRLKP